LEEGGGGGASVTLVTKFALRRSGLKEEKKIRRTHPVAVSKTSVTMKVTRHPKTIGGKKEKLSQKAKTEKRRECGINFKQ